MPIKKDANLKDIQILQKLGLTLHQARILVALAETGKARVLTVSRITNIDRSNVYRTIQQLYKMGLVIRVMSTPNFYQAIPLNEAVNSLINRKKVEYRKLLDIADGFLRIDSTRDRSSQENVFEFRIYRYTKEKRQKQIVDCCRSAKKSIDLLLDAKSLYAGVIDLAEDQLSCIKRGIKYRLITQIVRLDLIREKLADFLVQPSFQIRFINDLPKTVLGIIDAKWAVVNLEPKASIGEAAELFTDHSGCLEMFQSHFDKVWSQAREYKPKSNP